MSKQKGDESAFGVASGSAAAMWPTACPICGAATKWKLSGRGKHYGQICEAHGFIAIRRNPAFAQHTAAPRLTRWQRIGCFIFGLPNTQSSATPKHGHD